MSDNIDLEDLKFHGLSFTPDEEIAYMLGIELEELRTELLAGKTERARAILDGRLQRRVAIRSSILEMACRGSSPAQAEALRMMQRFE